MDDGSRSERCLNKNKNKTWEAHDSRITPECLSQTAFGFRSREETDLPCAPGSGLDRHIIDLLSCYLRNMLCLLCALPCVFSHDVADVLRLANPEVLSRVFDNVTVFI